MTVVALTSPASPTCLLTHDFAELLEISWILGDEYLIQGSPFDLLRTRQTEELRMQGTSSLPQLGPQNTS